MRHEAGEALGAIGTQRCFDLLRAFSKDPCLEVSQTCQLALQRIEYYAKADGCSSSHALVLAKESQAEPSMCIKTLGSQAVPSGSEACIQQHPCQSDDTMPSTAGQGSDTSGKRGDSSPYLSVDPAPAAPLSTPTPELRRLLLDEHAPIFKRYIALFALRNKGGREEVRLDADEICISIIGCLDGGLPHLTGGKMPQSLARFLLRAGVGAVLLRVCLLCQVAALEDSLRGRSALLKHEVAYVLGQVQDPAAIDALE